MLELIHLDITKKIVERLVSVGVDVSQAQDFALSMVVADVYGVKTHGSEMLESHVKKILANGYNLTPNITVVKETPSFAVIDGDNAIGPVSATFCMNYAIKKSKEVGMFTVFARNNNTLGPAFYYPMLAAEQGLIGVIATNSPAQMAPFGGKEKMLGTNPFSAVIPVTNNDPIIIDFATSVVAKSKFKEYANSGKELPNGWALDKEGRPTNDPKKGIEGLVLPMAGFKGYGLSMLIDILSGLLSGSAFLNHVGRFYSDKNDKMNVGYFITVIDPKQVLDEEYEKIINEYVKELRESQTVEGQTIVLPGDDRLACKNALLK